MGFYERLEILRKNAGIGQGKLEKELGIANGSISKWKNRTPKYATLEKLANYFGVSVDYLINGNETESLNNTIDSKSNNEINLISSNVSLLNGYKGSRSDHVVHIEIMDEPEIHMHSKFAYDLVKMMSKMPEEDLEFLANTAKRISPKDEEDDNRVPFSKYPNVTNKDIDEFAARNAKKKFSREEIAEMIFEMRKDD